MPRKKLVTRKPRPTPLVERESVFVQLEDLHHERVPLRAKKLELVDALVATIYRQSDTPVSDMVALGTALATAGLALKDEEQPTEIWAFVQTILALKQS